MRLRDIAAAAAADGRELQLDYVRHLGSWLALGVPALLSFLAIFSLTVARPPTL